MDGTETQTSPDFYAAAADLDAIDLTPELPHKPVLEQLGPPPFRKTSFPMMGFLASVYEHVAQQVRGENAPADDRM